MRRTGPIGALAVVLVLAGCALAPAERSAPSPPAAPSTAPTPTPIADLPGALREILRAPGPFLLRMERVQTSDTTTSRIVGTMRVEPSAWAAEGTRTDQAIGSSMIASSS